MLRAIKKGGLPATPGALQPRKMRILAEGTSAAALLHRNAMHIAGIKFVSRICKKRAADYLGDAAAKKPP